MGCFALSAIALSLADSLQPFVGLGELKLQESVIRAWLQMRIVVVRHTRCGCEKPAASASGDEEEEIPNWL